MDPMIIDGEEHFVNFYGYHAAMGTWYGNSFMDLLKELLPIGLPSI